MGGFSKVSGNWAAQFFVFFQKSDRLQKSSVYYLESLLHNLKCSRLSGKSFLTTASILVFKASTINGTNSKMF